MKKAPAKTISQKNIVKLLILSGLLVLAYVWIQESLQGQQKSIDLLSFRFEDGSCLFRIEGGIIVFLLLMALLFSLTTLLFSWPLFKKKNAWKAKSVTVKFGDLFEIELSPNPVVVRIAYQAWVEISTRKVGLPFDEKDDVIIEVYNSWYQLFGILRDLAKSVPAEELRTNKDAKELVTLLLAILNDGLRPHLTCWQAKFRRWYASEEGLEENSTKTPQEIQQRYQDYTPLVEDLKKINQDFVDFREDLFRLIEGEKT